MWLDSAVGAHRPPPASLSAQGSSGGERLELGQGLVLRLAVNPGLPHRCALRAVRPTLSAYDGCFGHLAPADRHGRKALGPGGGRAVIAENLLLRQQLIVLRRPR